MTDETVDEIEDETTRLIGEVKRYVKYTWKGMAKALSGHGYDITEAQLQRVGLGRVTASPQLSERVKGLAKQVGLKGVKLVDDDTVDVPAIVDLAVPMLSMGIGREAYEQTQRDYSGYYIGIRASERQTYICAWTKLLSLREAIGVPRFNTWRPDDGDGCVVSTGYYFSSTNFLYMVSHPINDVSIRYSALRKSSKGLIGITTGVSSTSTILSTNILLKRIADIGADHITRTSFIGVLGEFSADQIKDKFPDEAEIVLAQTSMVKPGVD